MTLGVLKHKRCGRTQHAKTKTKVHAALQASQRDQLYKAASDSSSSDLLSGNITDIWIGRRGSSICWQVSFSSCCMTTLRASISSCRLWCSSSRGARSVERCLISWESREQCCRSCSQLRVDNSFKDFHAHRMQSLSAGWEACNMLPAVFLSFSTLLAALWTSALSQRYGSWGLPSSSSLALSIPPTWGSLLIMGTWLVASKGGAPSWLLSPVAAAMLPKGTFTLRVRPRTCWHGKRLALA